MTNKSYYEQCKKQEELGIGEDIDIEGIPVGGVAVYSWCHSGPVDLTIQQVSVVSLLDTLGIERIEKYLEYKRWIKTE